MKMPFGKYKGKEIEDLPSRYLYWLATNIEDDDRVQEAADKEYHYRELYGCHFEED